MAVISPNQPAYGTPEYYQQRGQTLQDRLNQLDQYWANIPTERQTTASDISAGAKTGVAPSFYSNLDVNSLNKQIAGRAAATADLQANDTALARYTTGTNASGGAGVEPDGKGGYTYNGESISASEMNLVKGIINYTIDPTKSTSLRSNQRQRLMEIAATIDPTYDSSQFPSRQALRKDFTSGKGGQNIRSLNTAVQHIDELVKASNALKNTELPGINAIKNNENPLMAQPNVKAFNNAANAVAAEMATIFKNTSGTDEEIAKWRKNLNANMTPSEVTASVKTLFDLMSGRLTALNSQWETGMGKPKDFKILSDSSRKTLSKLGFDPEAIDPTPQELIDQSQTNSTSGGLNYSIK